MCIPRVCDTKGRCDHVPWAKWGPHTGELACLLGSSPRESPRAQKDLDGNEQDTSELPRVRELSRAPLQNQNVCQRHSASSLLREQKINVGRRNRRPRLERNMRRPRLHSVPAWSFLVLPRDGQRSLLGLKLSNPLDFCNWEFRDNYFYSSHKQARVFVIQMYFEIILINIITI